MKNTIPHLSGILSRHTRFIPLLGVLALVLAVPVTLNLIEQNQDNRQQAATPDDVVSVQQNPGAGGGATCESVNGTCIHGDEFLSTQYRFAAASTSNTYSCPESDHICLVQSLPTTENQTCTGQCHASATDCDTNNPGQQCTVDASGSCLASGHTCFNVAPLDPVASTNCSIAANGQEYCCPTGSTLCGSTSDTQCPLCVAQGGTCTSGSQFSEAVCTADMGGGSQASCDPTTQQTIDASCSSSVKGCTGPGQAFDKWACEQNTEGTGSHCVSVCTSS